MKAPFLQQESTYKIDVYTFNKTLLFKDRIEKIDVSMVLLQSSSFCVYEILFSKDFASYSAECPSHLPLD